MPKHTVRARSSQQESPPPAVPCKAQLCISSVCGCASSSAIRTARAGLYACPLGMPWGCPLKHFKTKSNTPRLPPTL